MNITYSSELIFGGTADSGTHNTGSGTVTTSIGSPTLYDGSFFDNSVVQDASLATVIQSDFRRQIDNGAADDYANYIGFSVEFSAPIALFTFGFLDLDGDTTGGNEWTSAFALNGASLVNSTVTAGSTGINILANETVNFGITNAPTMTSVAVQAGNVGNVTPNDPNGQVLFDFGGNLVTDVYFLFGIDELRATNGNNNSGVTGFTVVESVPEPSSTAMLGIGGLLLLVRRKRTSS